MADILKIARDFNPKKALTHIFDKIDEIIKKVNTLWSNAPTVTPKIYEALLNQSGTDVPTATELYNTLGDITFSRNQAGDYVIQSSALFTANKTHIIVGAATYPYVMEYGYSDSSNLYLATRTNLTGTLADDKLYETAITIKVYP